MQTTSTTAAARKARPTIAPPSRQRRLFRLFSLALLGTALATLGSVDNLRSARAQSTEEHGAAEDSGSDTSTSTSTTAEAPLGWGFAIYRGQRLLGSLRPSNDDVFVGSHASTGWSLRGLEPIHARFVRADEGVIVEPIDGLVLINGEPTATPVRVPFGYTGDIRLGLYSFVFLSPGSERVDPEASIEDGQRQAASASDRSRQPEFSSVAYQFCYNESFGKKGTEDFAYCAIMDDTSKAVCPAVKASCPWLPKKLKAPEKEESEKSLDLSLPKGMSLALAIFLIVLIVFLFVYSLAQANWRERGRVPQPGAPLAAELVVDPQSLPDAGIRQLILLAEQARARSEWRTAAFLLHAAVLRFCDDEGLVRFHPSKTNGDYLRALRRHVGLRAFFQSIARITERIRFGDGEIDVEQLDTCMGEARSALQKNAGAGPSPEGESPSTRPGTTTTGSILSVLFILAVTSTTLSGCQDPRGGHLYRSHAPSGLSALPKLLEAARLRVTVGRPTQAEMDNDDTYGLVVLRTSAADHGFVPPDLRIDRWLDKGENVLIIDDAGLFQFFLGDLNRGDEDDDQATTSNVHDLNSVRLRPSPADPEVFCSWSLSSLSWSSRGSSESSSSGSPGGSSGPSLTNPASIEVDQLQIPRSSEILMSTSLGAPSAAARTSSATDHKFRSASFLSYAEPPGPDGTERSVAIVSNRVDGDHVLPGCFVVLTSRALLTNASLTRSSNARYVSAMFSDLAGSANSVYFVDRLDKGFVSGASSESQPNPLQKVRASKLLPLLGQGFLLLIAFYVAIGAAFGPLKDHKFGTHKAFIEHVEAMGRRYARVGRGAHVHVAESLSRFLVMRNRSRIRGGRGGGWHSIAKHLAEQHGLSEEEVRAAFRLGLEGNSDLGPSTSTDPNPSSIEFGLNISRLASGRDRDGEEKKDEKKVVR